MKKIFTILLLALSLILLTGCKNPVIDEKPLIEQVKTNLEIDDELSEITLPTEIDGVIITWQSSKPGLITSNGEIIKPLIDTPTFLTATLSYDSKIMTKIFDVLILGDMTVEYNIDYNKVQDVVNSLTFEDYEIIDDIVLITTSNNINITWESNNDTILSSAGVVTRPADGENDALVILTATFTYNDIVMHKDYTFTIFSLTTTVIYFGYYTGADNLLGEELKAFLHDLIDDHTVIPYGDLWVALSNSDKDPSNPNNIILFYTGVSISNLEHGGNVGDWNREHIWARSHGDLDDYITDSDMHHIRPTDVMMNGKRGSLDFDNGGTVVYDGSIATDNYSDSDSWEPRDEVKGDVARMLFYMAVRYEGENPSLDLELNDLVNNIHTPYIGKISVLMAWHLNDLPDAFEINRNDVIQSYQGNRNPFIDHPEFAQYIWGTY